MAEVVGCIHLGEYENLEFPYSTSIAPCKLSEILQMRLFLAILPFPLGDVGPHLVFPVVFAEIVTFYLFQRREVSFVMALILVLCANFTTLLIGYMLLGLTAERTWLPRGGSPAALGISFLLCFSIQFILYRKMKLSRMLPRMLLTTLTSNLVGYAVLGGLIWCYGVHQFKFD